MKGIDWLVTSTKEPDLDQEVCVDNRHEEKNYNTEAKK